MPSTFVPATREAWRKYVSTGALARGALRDPVYRAWERCHQLGTSPLQPQAESLSADATERLLSARAELVSAARPYMAALSQAAGAERHAAMLGDAHAVVLDIVGDEQTVHGPEPFPGPGALLAEEVSGANGIGTPLAGDAYVELVGPEHFIGGFHVFTCQGLPVRAPDGSVAGVISTSVRRVEASARLRDILVCAARGIEAELLRARLEDDVRRVLASPSGGALARLRDDILQSFASARLRIEAASRRARAGSADGTLGLVAEAQQAMDRFRRQASLWRELATSEVSVPRRVSLEILVGDLVALLETEARNRSVELRADALEPAAVLADPRLLARALFTALLDAMEAAAAGGAVHVTTRKPDRDLDAKVHIRADPATSAGTPLRRQLRVPAARHPG